MSFGCYLLNFNGIDIIPNVNSQYIYFHFGTFLYTFFPKSGFSWKCLWRVNPFWWCGSMKGGGGAACLQQSNPFHWPLPRYCLFRRWLEWQRHKKLQVAVPLHRARIRCFNGKKAREKNMRHHQRHNYTAWNGMDAHWSGDGDGDTDVGGT